MPPLIRSLFRLPWLLPWAALAGGLACLWAGFGFEPEAKVGELTLRDSEFVVDRADGEPLTVTASTWRLVPYLFGDFDLTCDLDLSPGVELDLVFRIVEPRLVQDVALPFHARFALLRLSSVQEGPPYRTRREALFDQWLTGGASVVPDRPVRLVLQGRGRLVRAQVGGRWLPWVRTSDASGSFAFIARGGEARIQALRILPVGGGGLPLGVRSALFGAVLAMAVAAGAVAVGGHVPRMFLMLPILVVVAGIGRRMVLGDLLPLAVPDLSSVLLVGLAALPMSAALALPMRSQRWALPLGLLCVLGCWDLAARREAPRRQATEDPRLDLVFGNASGAGPLEALGRRVRGPYEVHTLEEREGPRVFFLGGRLLYGLTPEEDLTVWSTAELGLRLDRPIEGMALPTIDGHAQQQWLMFWGYYRDYAPEILVFGVSEHEMVADGRGPAQERREELLLLTEEGFAALPLEQPTGLASLLQGPVPAPRSSPGQLRQVLTDARSWCESAGHTLVLLAGPRLPDDLRAVLGEIASEEVPVIDLEGADLADRVRRVVAVLEPLLRRG